MSLKDRALQISEKLRVKLTADNLRNIYYRQKITMQKLKAQMHPTKNFSYSE